MEKIDLIKEINKAAADVIEVDNQISTTKYELSVRKGIGAGTAQSKLNALQTAYGKAITAFDEAIKRYINN